MATMTRYLPGDGFGADGITVPDNGYVRRFSRPVSSVVVKNTSDEVGLEVYVGLNELIEGAEGNDPVISAAKDAEMVQTITLAQALSKGVLVDSGETQMFTAAIDPVHGRREIYCMWFLVVEGKTGRVHGGVVGF